MKNKTVFFYIAAALSIIIPSPGRLGFGIILVLEMFFLVFFGTLLNSLIKHLRIEEFTNLLMFVTLFTLVIIFQQLLSLYSPIFTLTLGFSVYLTALSSMIAGFFASPKVLESSLSFRLSKNMKSTTLFSIVALLFYTVRDIFSFGTITLPGRLGLIEFKIIESLPFNDSFFWNSIPFALIMLAIFTAAATLINRKLEIIRRTMV